MGLASIYQPGYRYAKAGVMLLALNDASVEQGELALEDDAALLREAEGSGLIGCRDFCQCIRRRRVSALN
jgi:DNA polymerase V